MRNGISFTVSASDGQRLQAIFAALGTPRKHVWRARIVLLSSDGLAPRQSWLRPTSPRPVSGAGRNGSCTKASMDGLLRDRSRPPGKAPVPPKHVAEIVRLTQAPPPHEATHWTLRAMAKVAGVAASTCRVSGRPAVQPASLAALQALQRLGLRREAVDHRWVVC